MTTVSLTYYHDSKNYGNFGDELSPFIIQELLSSEYKLLLNASEADHSLLGIGSIIHLSKENDYVFGSGLGVLEPESLPHLNICAVRGPLTREISDPAKALSDRGSCRKRTEPIYTKIGVSRKMIDEFIAWVRVSA